MTDSKDHLTGEEALQMVHASACPQQEVTEPRLEDHLRHCQRCTRMVQQYRRFMSRLYEFGKSGQADGECPDPTIWGEVASGIVPQEEATRLLKHAASCQACVEELLNALEVLSSDEPVSQELQGMLATATPEWQKRFAANIAAKQIPIVPAVESTTASPHSGWFVFSRPWVYAAIAAALVLTVGISLYSWLRGASSENLIREAYAQQRTVEMRIPGAHYGPIQVQRAEGRSQISSPQALLEAQVQIKRGLDKKPEDADLLRQKAETDLLNWNYQPALETLNHASRLKSSSFELLVDTATAYFERAEATASPADYEAGLQALGDAIRLKPDDPAALFNRAILYERLYFYGRAIADWEALLKIEKDPGWRKEAEQRLKEIRERERQRSLWHDPDQLTLAQFKQDVSDPRRAGIEEYVEAAERRVLPDASLANANSESYRAAAALAENLESRHSDHFLKDMLLALDQPGFREATLLLGQSSTANHSGRHEDAYLLAVRSASLFKKADSTAGVLASQFEQSYALQFESKAGPCRDLARSAAVVAHERDYVLLETGLLLEQAICADMADALGPAKQFTRRALDLAKSHDYLSMFLRGLTVSASLEADAGNGSSAWFLIQQGLDLFWKSSLPAVRAYSFYALLDAMADRLGHANVQFAVAFEALRLRENNSNKVIEAAERARLGGVALRLGDVHTAEAQFQQAQKILSAMPQTLSVRRHELEALINLARVELLRGGNTGSIAATLLADAPELRLLSNRYLEFQYYETLAEIKEHAGESDAAEQFLQEAIHVADLGLESLSTWRERMAWIDQHRQPYVSMVELLFHAGKENAALDLWEHFRSATSLASRNIPKTLNISKETTLLSTSEKKPAGAILTYALVNRGVVIWVRNWKEIHAAFVSTPGDLRRTAETFIAECARPDSDLGNLRKDAQELYGWLIEPVKAWLPEAGHLVIEPDGILRMVPFEVLVNTGGEYLGTQHAITVASSVRGNLALANEDTLAATPARALVVAAPAAMADSPEPPPGARAEAIRIAERFHEPVVLLGRQASVVNVQRELGRSVIFHFAGHAGLSRNGAAMIMADGILGLNQISAFGAHHLDRLRLAVFSACDTASPSETFDSDGLVSEFLQAGARNVVASRWNVDSIATADFMGIFYQGILSGASVADSVQSAAERVRKAPGRLHPYYWAGFSAFGAA